MAYDNVILEICDEPSLFTPPCGSRSLGRSPAGGRPRYGSPLPKKHLVAQEVEGGDRRSDRFLGQSLFSL